MDNFWPTYANFNQWLVEYERLAYLVAHEDQKCDTRALAKSFGGSCALLSTPISHSLRSSCLARGLPEVIFLWCFISSPRVGKIDFRLPSLSPGDVNGVWAMSSSRQIWKQKRNRFVNSTLLGYQVSQCTSTNNRQIWEHKGSKPEPVPL